MLQPINDRIVVKKINQSEKSSGGVVLPSSAQSDIMYGTVLAVGPGRIDTGKRIKMIVEVGDTIVTFGQAGQKLSIDGMDVIVMSEGDIFGTIKE